MGDVIKCLNVKGCAFQTKERIHKCSIERNRKMKTSRILVLVVAVLVISLMSGCAGPEGRVALLRTANGTEVGSLQWGPSGIGITNAQYTALTALMKQYNLKKHEIELVEKENQLYANISSKKTSIAKVLIKKNGTVTDVKSIMGSTFGPQFTRTKKED